MAEDYYCTRPRLASLLMEKGYTAELKPNPWDGKKRAWVFPLTADLAETVLNYYTDIGQRAPAIIQQYFNRER